MAYNTVEPSEEKLEASYSGKFLHPYTDVLVQERAFLTLHIPEGMRRLYLTILNNANASINYRLEHSFDWGDNIVSGSLAQYKRVRLVPAFGTPPAASVDAIYVPELIKLPRYPGATLKLQVQATAAVPTAGADSEIMYEFTD